MDLLNSGVVQALPILSRVITTRLRTETSAIHRQMEDRINMEKRLCSSADYLNLLELFWGLYVALEPRLAALIQGQAWPLEWESREKLRLLEKDLHAMGLAHARIAGLPVCDQLPSLATPGRVLGVLYVLEGSTLGGQQISKMIQQKLGLGSSDGAAFFNGYGAETGAMWKKFGVVLTAGASEVSIEDEIIAAAKETFETFENWLCPPHAT
ncbi:MAG: hypothetical protein JWO94_1960 [Verrucomicrobiaceae bacterium]|nr:hypothetical protein [Verrucomicrobiaceae bacterium]